jgi:hypothetical protein
MTDAEMIKLLGGGKAGAKRFAKLRTLGYRQHVQQVFERCRTCGRLFINHRFWWIAHDELCLAGFDGLRGDVTAGTCRGCTAPSAPLPAHSTP